MDWIHASSVDKMGVKMSRFLFCVQWLFHMVFFRDYRCLESLKFESSDDMQTSSTQRHSLARDGMCNYLDLSWGIALLALIDPGDRYV